MSSTVVAAAAPRALLLGVHGLWVVDVVVVAVGIVNINIVHIEIHANRLRLPPCFCCPRLRFRLPLFVLEPKRVVAGVVAVVVGVVGDDRRHHVRSQSCLA